MQRFVYTVLARGTGLALRDALVTVYVAGTLELAELYSENSTSSEQVLNPLVSDAFGEIAAYIPNGRYDLRVDYAGQPTRIIPDVQVFDAAEFDVEVGPLARITGGANQIAFFAGTNIASITEFSQLARDIAAISDLEELQAFLGITEGLTLPLSIEQGGTSGETAEEARTALDVLSSSEVATAISDAIDALPAGPTPLYFVPFGFTSAPTVSEILLIHVFAAAVDFDADFAGATSAVGTPPAATCALDVTKNGSSVGTISISDAGAVTFDTSGAVSFAAGDVLRVVGPSPAPTAIANCAFTFRGERS